MKSKHKIFIIMSLILLIIGICLTPFVLLMIVNNDVLLDLGEKIFLWLISLSFVLSGILTLIYKQRYFSKLMMVTISIFVVLAVLEIGLRLGLSDLIAKQKIWAPLELQLADYSLNKKNSQVAYQNNYGFNDINHEIKKPIDAYRIAIIGDSFVWGHGVEDSVRWTRKLENFLNKNYDGIEVLHWGRNAWSSYDQIEFMKTEGYKYKPDLLINTFVINDPINQNTYDYYFFRRGGFVYRNLVYKYPGKLLGNILSLLFDYTSIIGAELFGISYNEWLENIYNQENLINYKKLLKDYKEFLNSEGIEYFFLFTPENNSAIIGDYFDKISAIMKELNIPHYNLFLEIEYTFSDYEPYELWASPVNNHPGNLVTQKIAELTYKYVLNNYLNVNASL